MKPLQQFEEYIKKGIARKQKPDFSRAESLLQESERTITSIKEIIQKIGINNNNANSIIKNLYDSLMEVIRSHMLQEGYYASGQGAHEAEVAYLRKLPIKEQDIQFINQLRHFRNGIVYYGKTYDKEYAEKVYKFLKQFKPQLEKTIKEKP